MVEIGTKKPAKRMLVRYGKIGYLGWFTHDEMHLPKTPKKVIIKTERGLEIGEIVGTNGCYSHGNFKCNFESLEEYYELNQPEYPIGEGGKFVRYATEQDLNEARHVRESAGEELVICRKYVRQLNLNMKVIEFEHIFGGERIVFYFLSEGRIDFRDLVKELAREFQTRIEMRQIGARDEARLISDIETCGQECCCKRYLKILKPVNMRMAKTQKATLDPSKISGHCGRLRCCLRYEDQTYQDLKKQMPNRQSWVKSEHGYGKVIDYQILTQLVRILHEDGKMEAFPLEELEIFDKMPEEVLALREERRIRDEQREKRMDKSGRDRRENKKTERSERRPLRDEAKDTTSDADDSEKQKTAENDNKTKNGERPERKNNRNKRKPRGPRQTDNPNQGANAGHPKPKRTPRKNRRNVASA